MAEEELADILIFSDQEYSAEDISPGSDPQFTSQTHSISQQVTLVEKKYRKYKKLRKILRIRIKDTQLNNVQERRNSSQLDLSEESSSSEERDERNTLADSKQDELQLQKIRLVPTAEMLNKERSRVIMQLKADNPSISFNQIFIELNKRSSLKENKFGKFKDISKTVVLKLLGELPANQQSGKLHPERNKEVFVEMRHLFCREFLKKLQKNIPLLFIDEHSFKLLQTGRDGICVDPAADSKPSCQRKEYFSLLTCFSLKGEAYFKISRSSAEKYGDWEGFSNLIEQACNSVADPECVSNMSEGESKQKKRSVCLIMDSIIVSNRSKQQKYREICKCSLLFLPPHSRQLNPIEVWFQSLREKIRKDSFSSNEELCQGIHYILKEQENYEFKQIVNQAIEQIKRGYAYGRF